MSKITLKEFIEQQGITMKVEVREGEKPEGFRDCNAWTVTLKLPNDEKMELPFYTGYGIKEVELRDVLNSLASDADSISDDIPFEDWAINLGLDPDSRRAEREFREVWEQTDKLLHWLGDDAFETLLYGVEEE